MYTLIRLISIGLGFQFLTYLSKKYLLKKIITSQKIITFCGSKKVAT